MDVETWSCYADLANMSIGSLDFETSEGGLVMDDCDLSGSRRTLINIEQGSTRVTNCVFSGPRAGLRLYCGANSTAEVRRTLFENDTFRVYFTGGAGSTRTVDITDCWFQGDGAVLVMGAHDEDLGGVDYDSNPMFSPESRLQGNVFSGAGAGMLLHSSVFPAVLGTNTLTDGARVFMWTRLAIKVDIINSTTDIKSTWCEPVTGPGVVTVLPFDIRWDIKYPLEQSHEADRETFVNVTAEPASGAHRTEFWVAAFKSDAVYGWQLVGYSPVDLRIPSWQLRFEAWPELGGLLVARIPDWPWTLPFTPP
jgi:hypothetical protein